ncbi:hypothetical protein EDM80_12050 [bacterium]|nr:MAG: hypothetical protein EDM80_12050 [bacterium]
MNAETAYLFRHALLRDAAYQLQLPADRARLHGLALAIMEELLGGRPPWPDLRVAPASRNYLLPADAFARELADHAEQADHSDDPARLSDVRCLYLTRASLFETARWRPAEAGRLAEKASTLCEGSRQAQLLTEAAGCLLDAGLLAEAEGVSRRLLELEATRQSASLHAGALNLLGKVLDAMGRHAQALPLAEEALRISESQGDPERIVRELSNLSGTLMYARELGRAVAVAARCIEMMEALGMKQELGLALGTLANCYQLSGRFDDSLAKYQEAVAALRTAGNKRSEGVTLTNMGALLLAMNRRDEAMDVLAEGLSLHRQVGNRRSEGICLGNYGNALFDQCRYAEALETYALSLGIHREVGNRRSEGVVLASLGNTWLQLGKPEDAERSLREAVAIHRELRNRRSEGIALGDLAEVYRWTNRYTECASLLQQALEADREVQNGFHEGRHLCRMGLTRLRQGQGGQAAEAFNRGVLLLRSHGGAAEAARHLADLESLCREMGVEVLSLAAELAPKDMRP